MSDGTHIPNEWARAQIQVPPGTAKEFSQALRERLDCGKFPRHGREQWKVRASTAAGAVVMIRAPDWGPFGIEVIGWGPGGDSRGRINAVLTAGRMSIENCGDEYGLEHGLRGLKRDLSEVREAVAAAIKFFESRAKLQRGQS